VRARVPGALILFLLRSSPSRFDVNDLQLDISLVPLSALSSPSVFLLLSFFLRPSDGAERPCRCRPRKRSAIFAGNSLPPRLPSPSLFLSLSLSLSLSRTLRFSRLFPLLRGRLAREHASDRNRVSSRPASPELAIASPAHPPLTP